MGSHSTKRRVATCPGSCGGWGRMQRWSKARDLVQPLPGHDTFCGHFLSSGLDFLVSNTRRWNENRSKALSSSRRSLLLLLARKSVCKMHSLIISNFLLLTFHSSAFSAVLTFLLNLYLQYIWTSLVLLRMFFSYLIFHISILLSIPWDQWLTSCSLYIPWKILCHMLEKTYVSLQRATWSNLKKSRQVMKRYIEVLRIKEKQQKAGIKGMSEEWGIKVRREKIILCLEWSY